MAAVPLPAGLTPAVPSNTIAMPATVGDLTVMGRHVTLPPLPSRGAMAHPPAVVPVVGAEDRAHAWQRCIKKT